MPNNTVNTQPIIPFLRIFCIHQAKLEWPTDAGRPPVHYYPDCACIYRCRFAEGFYTTVALLKLVSEADESDVAAGDVDSDNPKLLCKMRFVEQVIHDDFTTWQIKCVSGMLLTLSADHSQAEHLRTDHGFALTASDRQDVKKVAQTLGGMMADVMAAKVILGESTDPLNIATYEKAVNRVRELERTLLRVK
jgi:hypothetical protein